MYAIDLSLRAIKCCSVVFGVTLKLLVINISPSFHQQTAPLTTSEVSQLAERWSDGVVFITPASSSALKPDIGRESRFLPTPPAFDAPVRGFPSEFCYAVWRRKSRMAWLPDGEKILMICLFVLTQLTNVTDRQTHTDRQTPHDGIGCAYA